MSPPLTPAVIEVSRAQALRLWAPLMRLAIDGEIVRIRADDGSELELQPILGRPRRMTEERRDRLREAVKARLDA